MNDDGIYIEDNENFNSSELGIKGICLEQYRRCLIEGSKEMAKGGKGIKIFKGVPFQVDIPNQREIFVNCVKMLQTILFSDLRKNKEISKGIKDIDQEISDRKQAAMDAFNEFKEQNRHKNINWQEKKEELVEDAQIYDLTRHRDKLVLLATLLDDLGYYSESDASVMVG